MEGGPGHGGRGRGRRRLVDFKGKVSTVLTSIKHPLMMDSHVASVKWGRENKPSVLAVREEVRNPLDGGEGTSHGFEQSRSKGGGVPASAGHASSSLPSALNET